VRPALFEVSALPVRNHELAVEDDQHQKIEHTPSFRPAGIAPAAGIEIGGPSRFKGGMTRESGASHTTTAELRNGGGGTYTLIAEMTQTPPVVSERVEAAYRANYKLLSYLASARFRIPDDEVCAVVHDVFVSFIRSEARIGRTESDERSWLVGAVCNASRYYWRKRHGSEDLVTSRVDAAAVTEEALDRIELANVLRHLPERCRDLLCRRYVEGYTPQEIASDEALTSGSTRNLLSKCLVAARRAFSERRFRPRS
jgi:RNA polymerase sigma factor (sigma-70 family)